MPPVRSILKRWLRHTWLGRVPFFKGFFGSPCASRSAPKAKRKNIELTVFRLEDRWVPDDILCMAQGAIAGGVLAEYAAGFATPAQVLINGWGANQPPAAVRAPQHEAEASSSVVHARDLDTYFSSVSITPHPDLSRSETSRQQDETQDSSNESRKQEKKDNRLAYADPLGKDFLDDVLAALNEGGEEKPHGGGGGGAAPSSLLDHGNSLFGGGGGGGGGGGAGNSSAYSDPASVGGGVGGSGSPTGFNPFDFISPDSAPAAGNSSSPLLSSAAQTSVTLTRSVSEGLNAAVGEGEAQQRQPLPVSPPVFDGNFARIPLAFEKNSGQLDGRVQYMGGEMGSGPGGEMAEGKWGQAPIQTPYLDRRIWIGA